MARTQHYVRKQDSSRIKMDNDYYDDLTPPTDVLKECDLPPEMEGFFTGNSFRELFPRLFDRVNSKNIMDNNNPNATTDQSNTENPENNINRNPQPELAENIDMLNQRASPPLPLEAPIIFGAEIQNSFDDHKEDDHKKNDHKENNHKEDFPKLLTAWNNYVKEQAKEEQAVPSTSGKISKSKRKRANTKKNQNANEKKRRTANIKVRTCQEIVKIERDQKKENEAKQEEQEKENVEAERENEAKQEEPKQSENCEDVETQEEKEKPALQAPDLTSLLLQFEASEDPKICPTPYNKPEIKSNLTSCTRSNKTRQVTKTECRNMPKKSSQACSQPKDIDSLPKEVLERIKASSVCRKAISIPAMPNIQGANRNNVRTQDTKTTLPRNKALKTITNNAKSRVVSATSVKLVQMDHDYCNKNGVNIINKFNNTACTSILKLNQNKKPDKGFLEDCNSILKKQCKSTLKKEVSFRRQNLSAKKNLCDHETQCTATTLTNKQIDNSLLENDHKHSQKEIPLKQSQVSNDSSSIKNVNVPNKVSDNVAPMIRSALATSILQSRNNMLSKTNGVQGNSKMQMVSVLKKPPNTSQSPLLINNSDENIATTTSVIKKCRTTTVLEQVQNIITPNQALSHEEQKKPRKKLNLAEYRSRRDLNSRTNSPIQPTVLEYVHHAFTTTEPNQDDPNNPIFSEREIISVLKLKSDIEDAKNKTKPPTCDVEVQVDESDIILSKSLSTEKNEERWQDDVMIIEEKNEQSSYEKQNFSNNSSQATSLSNGEEDVIIIQEGNKQSSCEKQNLSNSSSQASSRSRSRCKRSRSRRRRSSNSTSRSRSKSNRSRSRSRRRNRSNTRSIDTSDTSRSRSRSRSDRSRSRSRSSRSKSSSHRSRSRSPRSRRSRSRSRRSRSRSYRRSGTRQRRLSHRRSSVSSTSTWSSQSRSHTTSSPNRSRYSRSRSRSRTSSSYYSNCSRSSSSSNFRRKNKWSSSRRRSSRERERSYDRYRRHSSYMRRIYRNRSNSRSPIRSYNRSYDNTYWHNTEKETQIQERRVVYVGCLEQGVTKTDLRLRFQRFGSIVNISVHFREHGDNYGFVTFARKEDAYQAVEHGNDNPSLPRYELSFGGRRGFCKAKYSDLDDMANYSPHIDRMPGEVQREESFDFLLQDVKSRLSKSKKKV